MVNSPRLFSPLHFYVDQKIRAREFEGLEMRPQLWGNRWLYVYSKQYWRLFHDVTMMSISWEWNRICYLHAKFWPLPLWCHSYIMHNLDAACLWLKWSSQLVHSFTVTVCASYRGRGLGSTLCKSLVMHNLSLLVTEQLSLCLYMYENRGSFLLRKFPTVYGISWVRRLPSPLWLVEESPRHQLFHQISFLKIVAISNSAWIKCLLKWQTTKDQLTNSAIFFFLEV